MRPKPLIPIFTSDAVAILILFELSECVRDDLVKEKERGSDVFNDGSWRTTFAFGTDETEFSVIESTSDLSRTDSDAIHLC